MDFKKLGRALVEKTGESLAKHQHLLQGLAQGEIRIPQELLNKAIQKAAESNAQVSKINLECREGSMRANLSVRNLKLLQHDLTLDFRVESFVLSNVEQFARLRFEEGATPEARNWGAKVASWFVDVSIDELMSDPKRAVKIESTTGGVVRLQWPLAELLLDQNSAVNTLQRLNVFSLLKITECRVIPGFLVFPVSNPIKEGTAPMAVAPPKPDFKASASSENHIGDTTPKRGELLTLTLSDIYANEDAQLNFLRGCVCLAQADGVVIDSEKVFFVNAAIGMGMSQEGQKEVAEWLESDQDPNNVTFDSKRQKLFFMREALQLCYIDGHLSDAERKLLVHMCEKLGVSGAAFEYIEDWVKDGMAWRQDGERLLDLEA